MAHPPRESSSRPSVAAGTAVDPPSARVSAPPQSIRWNNPLIATAGLIVLVFVAYWPLTHGKFFGDDFVWLVQNHFMHHWSGLKYIWGVFGTTDQYYPLTFTALLAQYKMWGANAVGFHLVSLFLQALNAVLLWRILTRLGLKSAWVIAAVFAIHPVQVESLGIVLEQRNLLSATFYFGAALAWVRWDGGLDSRGAGAPGDSLAAGLRPTAPRRIVMRCSVRTAWYLLASLFYCLALLAKSDTCTLPAALLLVTWWKLGRLMWRDILATLPWFVFGLLMAGVTIYLEHPGGVVAGSQFSFALAPRLLIAGKNLWFYPWKLLWPWPLLIIYPRWHVGTLGGWAWLYPLTAFALPAILLLGRRKIGRGPFTALAFYGMTVAPVLGFISWGFMTYSFVADHFQYLPCIGLIALVTEGFLVLVANTATGRAERLAPQGHGSPCYKPGAALSQRSDHQKPVAAACSSAALLVLGVLTWRQSGLYASELRNWKHNLRYNPSAFVLGAVGVYECRHGHAARGLSHLLKSCQLSGGADPEIDAAIGTTYDRIYHKYPVAIPYYQLALRHDSYMLSVILALGHCYERLGNWIQARADLKYGLKKFPRSAALHFELANVLVMQRNYSAAARQYRDALCYERHNTQALYNLALTLEKLGQWPKALLRFRQALRVSPQFAQGHFEYGKCLYLHGQAAAAAQQFQQVIHFWPNQPVGYRALARALTTLGHPRQAAAASAEATRLQQRNSLPPPPP